MICLPIDISGYVVQPTCVDIEIDAVIPDKYRDAVHHTEQLPVCIGEWVSLPYPTPKGSYGMIFIGRVIDGAPKEATITVKDGTRVLGVIHFGETMSWECKENAHPERSA